MLELCDTLDAVKIDLKGFNPTFYRDTCRAELEPILETLQTVRRAGKWLEIVVLIIPTLNDSPGECRRMCEWIVQNLGPDVPVHFSRFHPNYKLQNLPPTPTRTLERNREIARKAGVRFAYVGNVPGHEFENTFCPDCGAKIISRYGFVAKSRLKNGACPDCAHPIPGIWAYRES
jgi:pyruvate formate lyase activating enzyme